jgi:hypothetical protein
MLEWWHSACAKVHAGRQGRGAPGTITTGCFGRKPCLRMRTPMRSVLLVEMPRIVRFDSTYSCNSNRKHVEMCGDCGSALGRQLTHAALSVRSSTRGWALEHADDARQLPEGGNSTSGISSSGSVTLSLRFSTSCARPCRSALCMHTSLESVLHLCQAPPTQYCKPAVLCTASKHAQGNKSEKIGAHARSRRQRCSRSVIGDSMYPCIVGGADDGEEHHQPAPHPGGTALLLLGLRLDVARLQAEATIY